MRLEILRVAPVFAAAHILSSNPFPTPWGVYHSHFSEKKNKAQTCSIIAEFSTPVDGRSNINLSKRKAYVLASTPHCLPSGVNYQSCTD